MLRSWRRRLTRVGRWPRLGAAGLCVALAVTSAVGARRGGAAPKSVAVVVARRTLPAGHLITRADVAVAHWPPGLRPAGARADPAALLGRRLAGPVGVREPLTVGRLVGRDLTAGLPPGLAAVAVGLDDPHGGDLVHPGDRVDLLAAAGPPDVADLPAPTGAAVEVVASSTLVLAVLAGADGDGPELVLAVDRATAVRITRDRAGHVFTALGVPP